MAVPLRAARRAGTASPRRRTDRPGAAEPAERAGQRLDLVVAGLATEPRDVAVERSRDTRGPEGDERRRHLVRGDSRDALLDDVAQVGAELRGVDDGAAAGVVDRRAVERSGREHDSQPSGRRADLREKGSRRRRRPVWIAGVGAGRRVEQRRAVAYRSRHRVLDDQAAHQVAELRAERIPSTASA